LFVTEFCLLEKMEIGPAMTLRSAGSGLPTPFVQLPRKTDVGPSAADPSAVVPRKQPMRRF
jgi:hypothetical protein